MTRSSFSESSLFFFPKSKRFDSSTHSGTLPSTISTRTFLRSITTPTGLWKTKKKWWCWSWKQPTRRFSPLASVKRWLLIILIMTILYISYCTYKTYPNHHSTLYGLSSGHIRPEVMYQCPTLPSGMGRLPRKVVDHTIPNSSQVRIDPKVLVFLETTFSKLGRDIAELLVHIRMKYRQEVTGKSLPILTTGEKGRFGIIVFENYTKYLYMDKWNKELLDKYCREYNVGIVGFLPSRDETYVGAHLKNTSLFIDTNVKLKDAYLNPNSGVLRLTRAGDIIRGLIPNEPTDLCTVFTPNHTTYEPVSLATLYPSPGSEEGGSSSSNAQPLITVIQDKGEADGIRRVLFGAGLKFWLNRLLFMDALSYLSRGHLSVSLKRYLLIDVDDMFVAEKGARVRPSDVEAMLQAQERIRALVPGFKFNLGFSGKYFHSGSDEENAGDDLILQNSDKFMWFGHMWNHIQPHLYSNVTQLAIDMTRNKDFAKEHGIPIDSGYSVSPHHSGVYPVHEELYDAWKRIWNVKVTSTEEYPHLRPARLRRGFIHRGIMVLPRQTCGLFTHTIFIDRYPGGHSKLDESIFGGELFQTMVYNSINVYMTHMPNYGNDRLALYTFESAIRYIQCWTNLQFNTYPPVTLAEKYFKMHADEIDPIWGNPCDDPRHRKIWSANRTCDSLPDFLIIGPQKTGTTALHTFLTMHPAIGSNRQSPETFEEVQFFNGKNYFRGLDWYMKFFTIDNSTTVNGAGHTTTGANNGAITNIGMKPILFEKSATYFDNEAAPRRAHALLPRAKLVTLLISPAKRAYSWYQHMRAHNDPVAINYTFYDVLTATTLSVKPLRDLRNRCISPGRYSHHLERWLSYFPSQQLIIIDGEELRNDPASVMNRLQHFLTIDPVFDYSKRLRYDKNKGFYCQITNQNKSKCLGRSKGRVHPPMDPRAAKYLQMYYLQHNTALVRLLHRLEQPIPSWLKEDLQNS